MIILAFLVVGLLLGLCVSIVLFRLMLAIPATRIWLSDRVNWSNNELPDNTYQLVRHGKWIAAPSDSDD
ncbi:MULTISPECIES: hypothetical protein [Limnobacter]|uniref:Uncharacterized protein n=1 Tax=Limnobacter litoralis TaxID=481366 RepID=A0ABQ5YQI5_9BURK|nr:MULTISPECIES: hypothetical protein [Limnobacter]GLR25496.1 hypothetical protein GCM10007875_05840 [Limnobacter litoralis]HEX5484456.1 hypothetical protein [Limnobacter sp.]